MHSYRTDYFDHIRGKTVAIIYIFENEDAPGFKHYWVWKSNIISGWMMAVQEIGCLPFILDVRTFIQKAINRTLPHIDYVLNLNCGSCDLSSMSLVPSMCSFLSVPCIPCDAAAITAGENKQISNLLASAMGLIVPEELKETSAEGVFRPLNLGSSIGLKKGHYDFNEKGVYQKLIPGYDVTIPILYNPIINDIDLLPAVIYIPTSKDPQWMYDEAEKIKDDGFTILQNPIFEKEAYEKLRDFARVFPISTYGRIDARIHHIDCLDDSIAKEPISLENMYFIEINPMPTIEKNDSFEFALASLQKIYHHPLNRAVEAYMHTFNCLSINGFILACSMLALAKAKY